MRVESRNKGGEIGILKGRKKKLSPSFFPLLVNTISTQYRENISSILLLSREDIEKCSSQVPCYSIVDPLVVWSSRLESYHCSAIFLSTLLLICFFVRAQGPILPEKNEEKFIKRPSHVQKEEINCCHSSKAWNSHACLEHTPGSNRGGRQSRKYVKKVTLGGGNSPLLKFCYLSSFFLKYNFSR